MGPAGAFVGRDREMELLLDGFEEARSGTGRIFLLIGEAGIGKTRLASEVARRAQDRGARVLWGRCWEAGGAPAYWPWVQAIRAYIRSMGPGDLKKRLGPTAPSIALILPELREMIPDLSEPPALDAEGARFRMFDDVARFLRDVAEVQPLVLVFDDLHAADEPSLLLLRFVAPELLTTSAVVIALSREVDEQHPLSSAVVELLRHQGVSQLSLTGLGESDVARFIQTVSGVSAPTKLVSLVHEETEGNPLFVGEIVRLLADEGRLQTFPGIHFRLEVPEGAREVIGRRLGHLSEDCTRLLPLASVFGREFGLHALESLTRISSTDLLRRLEEATSAHVLVEVPGALGRWRFAHALIREALYEDLGVSDRVRLHREVGTTLEDMYAKNPEPHLAELAHHFFHATPGGDVDKAVEYARRAADRAAGLLAYEEAVRLYRMALDALELKDSATEDARCRLLLAVGNAQARGGDLSAAQVTFLEAVESARKSESPELLAAAAIGYGGRFVWPREGGDPHLVPLLEEALAAIGDRVGPLRVRLLARLSGAIRDRPPREMAANISGEAVELARRLDDPATLAYALEGRFGAVWWPETPEERLGIATEILQLAERARDPERVVQGHDWRMCALMELGEMAMVDAELAAEELLVEELRQPAQLWLLTHASAMRALFDGRFEEAEALIEGALALGLRAQRWDAVFGYRVQKFLLRKEQGRLEEMEQIIGRSITEYPTRYLFRCLLAHLYAELHRSTRARRALEALASNDFADLRMDSDWLFALSLLSEVAEYLGDAARAEVLYHMLLPFADRVASTGEASTGSVARVLGILASTLSRWDEAAMHFENALEANETMGALPWAIYTKLAFARLLFSTDRPGDRERAGALIAEAVQASRELGMVALESKVASFAHESGLAPFVSMSIGAPAPGPLARSRPGVFRREGEYWSISFEGDAFRL